MRFWAAILIVLLPAAVSAETYYADTAGSDSANGLTTATAWLTLAKATNILAPGDTLYMRAGTYKVARQVGFTPDNFSADATVTSPITVRSYPGERAVITSCLTAATWTRVGATQIWYSDAASTRIQGGGHGIYGVIQGGVPLALKGDLNTNGTTTTLLAAGQWCAIGEVGVRPRVFAWCRASANPNSVTMQISEQPEGGSATIYIDNNADDDAEGDYIHFTDLTIEGAYYCVAVGTDGCEFTSCTLRYSAGEAMKVLGSASEADPDDFNATSGTVTACTIYNFGGVGIDVTGGDGWTISDNTITSGVWGNVDAAQPGSGIMLKNGAKNCLVEGNVIQGLRAPALFIGGASFSGRVMEASNVIVRGNRIIDCRGTYASYEYVALFMSASHCELVNNTFYDCHGENSIIRIGPNGSGAASTNTTIANNILTSISCTATRILAETSTGLSGGLTCDYNAVPVDWAWYLGGAEYTLAQWQKEGYDTHSITADPLLSTDVLILPEGSPAIDAGTIIAGVTPSYFGMAPDLGYAETVEADLAIATSGTCTVTQNESFAVKYVDFAWTSDSDGAVAKSVGCPYLAGEVLFVVTKPGSGATAPSANYDLTLEISNHPGMDILDDSGLNRSQTAVEIIPVVQGTYDHPVVNGSLLLEITHAGDSNSGLVRVYYR
jgi:hypothetical protein